MNAAEHEHTRYFLATCSQISLGNFLLARQNRAANLERDIADRVQELLEHLVFIELASLLRGTPPAARISQKSLGVIDLAASPKLIAPEGWHWIWERTDLSSNRKSVLQCIKRFCHAGHWGSFRWKELVALAGLSRATVARCIAELKEKHFIETEFDVAEQTYRVRLLKPPATQSHGETTRSHGETTRSHGETTRSHGGATRATQGDFINNVKHVRDVKDVDSLVLKNGDQGSGVALTPEAQDPNPHVEGSERQNKSKGSGIEPMKAIVERWSVKNAGNS